MEDSEKSYTRQDKFMGFFILTLLFLEHPCAQAALDLTGSRAHLQAEGASSPSWHHCGEGQSPIMWNPPGSDAIPQVSITGEPCHRRDQHWLHAEQGQDPAAELQNVLLHLGAGFMASRAAGGCLRRYRVRINQPNQSGSDVPDHGSTPMSEKHPRSMHNFIRIWSHSSTNLQLRHQLAAPGTMLCHLSLSMSVAVKKHTMPTVFQLPLTLERRSCMQEINWARI